MRELWSSASYEPHLLSLIFALAPAAMLVVLAYAAVMRGAPALRGFLVCHCVALLPYATVMMLSPSITSPAVAARMFRVAAGFLPIAVAAGTGVQLALLGTYRRYHWWAWACVASAVIWVGISTTTAAVVDGVQWMSGMSGMSGFWYARPGRWGWLALLHTLGLTLPGSLALGRAALAVRASPLRAARLANLVTYGAIVDVALACDLPIVPLGWALSGIGSALLVRALVAEDLLRVRAVDATPPRVVVYFVASALLGWLALGVLGAPLPWPVTTLTLVMCCLAIRVSIATIGLVTRGARGATGSLDRLLAQLIDRAAMLTEPPAIAQLTSDIIERGLGLRPQVLLAAPDDWGWTGQDGNRLADARAPDPLLASWLAGARDAVFADDLQAVPADLRDPLARLLASHAARVLLPVASADELLGLVLVPTSARRVRAPARDFLARACERLAEALLHARLARRAGERAQLAREVELAATVQAELLPSAAPQVFGRLTVVGSWQPATRCAGDFWTVTSLGPPGARASPVLIAIGDVAGHGVASAMVAAAALGACEVCVRRGGAGLELAALIAALDAAVRRVGGGGLAMTCFAAILDPAAGELRFVSCGHAAPYLCRPSAPASPDAIELHALVGRGNPLGVGALEVARIRRRPLEPGDLVVWYTDGVVEAQDPTGAPFGDRRLQHLLKKLDRARVTPALVHALVQRGVAAHRAGRPRGDDETLVVAQLAATDEAAS